MGSSSSNKSRPSQQTLTDTSRGTTGDVSPINDGGLQISARGGVNFDASPLVVQSALDAVNLAVMNAINTVGATAREQTETISNLVTSGQSSQAAALESDKMILQDVLARQSSLAAQTQSQGQTETNKTILYIVAAALAVVGLLGGVFLWQKKS